MLSVDFDILTFGICFLLYVPVFLFLKFKCKKNKYYMGISFIMFIYLCEVLNYTQFPILIHCDQVYDVSKNINYIPIYGLSVDDMETVLLNIILTIPFGFFLTIMYKQALHITIIIGLSLGIVLEGLQFLVSKGIGVNFRVIDINDVIFNCIGVILGWFFYVMLRKVYLKNVNGLHIKKSSFLHFCFTEPNSSHKENWQDSSV